MDGHVTRHASNTLLLLVQVLKDKNIGFVGKCKITYQFLSCS